MKALLTLDWQAPDDFLSVGEFYRLVDERPLKKHFKIKGCESLFRRRPAGFAPLKQLLSTMREISSEHPEVQITCAFNVFAYCFLVGAKNYDLLLPETTSNPFRKSEPSFMKILDQLDLFEQSGNHFPASQNKNIYLAVRNIITRPSAREERRILCELLISGRSTKEDLAEELHIWPDLLDRTLPFFVDLSLVATEGEYYLIESKHLPLTYFLLRATMGLSPLEVLPPCCSIN